MSLGGDPREKHAVKRKETQKIMSLRRIITGKVLLVIYITSIIMGSSILVYQYLFNSWADEMIVKEILKELPRYSKDLEDKEQFKIIDSKIEIRKKSWGPFLGLRWRTFGVITIIFGLGGILLYLKVRRRKTKQEGVKTGD